MWFSDPAGGHDEGLDDTEQTKYTNELLELMALEGGDNLYRGSFEDQYGDIHDWQSGVITHHYLCRQLYLHYNQQVRWVGLEGAGLPLQAAIYLHYNHQVRWVGLEGGAGCCVFNSGTT